MFIRSIQATDNLTRHQFGDRGYLPFQIVQTSATEGQWSSAMSNRAIYSVAQDEINKELHTIYDDNHTSPTREFI